MFYGSFGYWTSLLVPLAAPFALLIVFRRRALENADLVKVRSNKANKIATKRLKKAHLLMLGGKQEEFYDEVLRALWAMSATSSTCQPKSSHVKTSRLCSKNIALTPQL